MTAAAYDDIADWYAGYVTEVSAYSGRVHDMLRELLGRSSGSVCVDICCGTGARAGVLRELGWRPIGVDISAGQLRHASAEMPVVQGDATALPIDGERLHAAVCVLAHTDVPDYAAVVREAARILRPGGVFVHIGVHPSFVGAFADRSDPAQVRIDAGYHRRDKRFDSFSPSGVRVRVGAWHTPLPDLLHAAIDAGLRLTRIVEGGVPDAVPEILGFSARKS
jgi:ubiquinone/menaquinone biosynthesis C-methylase UbiE